MVPRWILQGGNMSARWRIDEENLVLTGAEDAQGYEIDLEDFTSSAGVLDWIVQLSKKVWMTDEDIGRLIRGLDTLFGFQESCCSFGRERGPKTVEWVKGRIAGFGGLYLDEASEMRNKALREIAEGYGIEILKLPSSS